MNGCAGFIEASPVARIGVSIGIIFTVAFISITAATAATAALALKVSGVILVL